MSREIAAATTCTPRKSNPAEFGTTIRSQSLPESPERKTVAFDPLAHTTRPVFLSPKVKADSERARRLVSTPLVFTSQEKTAAAASKIASHRIHMAAKCISNIGIDRKRQRL